MQGVLRRVLPRLAQDAAHLLPNKKAAKPVGEKYGLGEDHPDLATGMRREARSCKLFSLTVPPALFRAR